MDKQRAEEILGKDDFEYFSSIIDEMCLDGYFTADELEAIVWIMRNSK